MKTLIAAALLVLPSLASAHTVVRCSADEAPSSRMITIVSDTTLLAEKLAATVMSNFGLGLRNIPVEAERMALSDGQVVLKLKTLDERPTEAVMTLATRLVEGAPSLLEAAGDGTIQITDDPNDAFRIHHYTLTGCQGLL